MAESQQKNKKQKSTENNVGMKGTLATTVLVLVLLGVVVLLYFTGLRYRAEMYHTQAIRSLNATGNIKQAQRLEGNAINLAGFEDRYHRTLSRIYLARLNKVMNDGELSETQRRNQMQTLITRINQQARRAKGASFHDMANWANQGSIYRTLMGYGVEGADKMAIKGYQRAIELAPANPELHLQIARVYIAKADAASQSQQQPGQQSGQQSGQQQTSKQDLKQAMDHLEKAIELKPNYWSAHFQQAIVYDRQGKTDQAIQKLSGLKQVRPQDQSLPFQLGILHFRNDDLDKAKQEFERALEINSDFANARYFLGLLYDRQGQKQQAIDQFEKIASLGKQNQQQVQSILKNLRAGKPALGKTQTPEEMPELESEATTTPAEIEAEQGE